MEGWQDELEEECGLSGLRGCIMNHLFWLAVALIIELFLFVWLRVHSFRYPKIAMVFRLICLTSQDPGPRFQPIFIEKPVSPGTYPQDVDGQEKDLLFLYPPSVRERTVSL